MRLIDGRFANPKLKTDRGEVKIELEDDDSLYDLIEEAVRIRYERDRLAARYKELQHTIAAEMEDREVTILEHPDYWVDFADKMSVPNAELIKELIPEGRTLWIDIEPTVSIIKKR